MSLRLKLLLLFISGALSGLTFFGYIAYDTAQLASIKNETAIIAAMAPQFADHVQHNIERERYWPQAMSPADGARADNPIHVIVTDRAGLPLWHADNPAILGTYLQLRETAITRTERSNGNAEIAGTMYVWATADVPQQSLRVVLYSRALASTLGGFFREMGVSLLVTALFLLWLASWAAMYIAMLFEKLDEQKNILRMRALHDELTGLPNRALLNDRLQQLISTAEREPTSAALVFVDLNRFKEINDTLGHYTGDALLTQVAQRLVTSVRRSDTVARIGGDEFAMLLRSVDQAKAMSVVEKTQQALEQMFEIDDHRLYSTASFGIALFPLHATTVEVLMQKADAAMYASKRSGTRVSVYRPEHDVFSRDKLALTHDLRDAIHGNRLELYYQPKYNIAENSIIGAEALLRWKHASHGFIPPATFVQIAEHTGLIRPLSVWVLRQAFTDQKDFAAQGYDLNVAINLSAQNLQDSDIEREIEDLLRTTGVNPAHITLEITESAVVYDIAHTQALLNRLSKRGFRVSVDDFGTGYSTLSNLRRLPIAEIKVDRSFVKNMVTNSDDASIVRTTVDLGHALGIDVVAEGVETEEILNALRDMGCKTIQGYYISKPVPGPTLIAWLNDYRAARARSV